jgi:EAL domain-containing protein (putative c-di-GMP-specific phosphodiesterase class I)
MRPQTLAPVCATATADHCAFAVQSIRSLKTSQTADFGDQWPWFELLIRPSLPEGGDSTSAFIDRLYAERAPHLTDCEVLDRAMHWLMRREIPTRVSVNTHPLSLTAPMFRDRAIQAQRRVSTRGHSICLELVEFGECRDRDALIRNARSLRHHGLLVALDDFGSRINCFDLCAAGIIDIVKIDVAIVSQLHRDRFQRAIVDSIARLGSGIDAQVVAEGVETRAELGGLEDLGIEFGQGFYFHRPELSEI